VKGTDGITVTILELTYLATQKVERMAKNNVEIVQDLLQERMVCRKVSLVFIM
jgi:hypothetical protein